MSVARPEAMALVGVPDGGGVVLGAGEEEVSAAAGCCRRNASGCSWPFIRTRLVAAAGDGWCGVVGGGGGGRGSGVEGKNLKVSGPRVRLLEERLLGLAFYRCWACFKNS